MDSKRVLLISLLSDAYNGLGSYRAVAEACDNVVSHTMIQKVVEAGAWSPTLARHFGLKRRRYRRAAEFDECRVGLWDLMLKITKQSTTEVMNELLDEFFDSAPDWFWNTVDEVAEELEQTHPPD